VRCHGGEKDKFLNFATIYLVFLLKNVANESKAFCSLLKTSDYKLIQIFFAEYPIEAERFKKDYLQQLSSRSPLKQTVWGVFDLAEIIAGGP
jgi:hypothetical protein